LKFPRYAEHCTKQRLKDLPNHLSFRGRNELKNSGKAKAPCQYTRDVRKKTAFETVVRQINEKYLPRPNDVAVSTAELCCLPCYRVRQNNSELPEDLIWYNRVLEASCHGRITAREPTRRDSGYCGDDRAVAFRKTRGSPTLIATIQKVEMRSFIGQKAGQRKSLS
jgi:hypothetical protein